MSMACATCRMLSMAVLQEYGKHKFSGHNVEYGVQMRFATFRWPGQAPTGPYRPSSAGQTPTAATRVARAKALAAATFISFFSAHVVDV